MHRGLVVLLAVLWMGGVHAQDTGPIVSEAVIEAAPSEVWAVWSTGAGLRTWLAPHAEIDLRIGGLMRTNYNPQGTLGDPSTIENAILSFEPDRMLSIRVVRTPEGFPFATAIQKMWTVIYLDPVDGGLTRIRVVGLGFTSTEESQRMREFFQIGNDATVRQLQDRFTAVRID